MKNHGSREKLLRPLPICPLLLSKLYKTHHCAELLIFLSLINFSEKSFRYLSLCSAKHAEPKHFLNLRNIYLFNGIVFALLFQSKKCETKKNNNNPLRNSLNYMFYLSTIVFEILSILEITVMVNASIFPKLTPYLNIPLLSYIHES